MLRNCTLLFEKGGIKQDASKTNARIDDELATDSKARNIILQFSRFSTTIIIQHKLLKTIQHNV